MTWFAVDDSFFGHPKLAELEAGPCFAQAIALWTVAGSWCAHHLTDGRVPAAQLRRLVPFGTARATSELVRVGLWTEADGGYQFRDWTHYQPTKTEVEESRAKSAARTRKSRMIARERSASESCDTDVSNVACNGVTRTVTDAVTSGVTNALDTLPRPVPSRPVPILPDPVTLPLPPRGVSPSRVGGLSPEHVRTEYLARFTGRYPGKLAPMVARGPGAPIWDELARVVVDVTRCAELLDAAFADPFCVGRGCVPTVVRGCADRLLTVGPETKPATRRGPVEPTSHEDFAAYVAANGSEVFDAF